MNEKNPHGCAKGASLDSTLKAHHPERAAQALRLFIIGSCVSRDALSLIEEVTDIELVRYVARTSFASQACRPWRDNVVLDAVASAFQRRMVEFDMRKSVLAAVDSTPFDVLLIDLIDDRFALLEYKQGCFATASSEFVKAVGGKPRGRRISNSSDEFEALWTAGFSSLVKFLDEKKLTHTLRINQVFWAERDSNGNAIPNVNAQVIQDANERLARRYEQIKTLVPAAVFYQYPDACFVADANHRWGLSPYHYAPDLYRATLSHLRNERDRRVTPG
jgi:hypothetical protein